MLGDVDAPQSLCVHRARRCVANAGANLSKHPTPAHAGHILGKVACAPYFRRTLTVLSVPWEIREEGAVQGQN